MGIKLLFVFFVIIFALLAFPIKPVYAIENPFASFNNKFGIHILFPDELPAAADLGNSSGGDWGYVTIPIQAYDRDIIKWQQFMDNAKKLHIIPIIRLATEGDYFNTIVWRKPNETDIIDFANFLNSLDWPVKNRYIIIFNEVNRADEWGGSVNPAQYAKLLGFAINIFKSKNQDFFIISAGLDNAAPNSPPNFENEYDYLREMNKAVPGIFNQIDGLSSHSYPNPGFSRPPTDSSRMGINSFNYERNLISSMNGRKLPVFITETGWSSEALSDLVRADYYQKAFNSVWSDNGVAAVTPFLLRANGSFKEFSFFTEDGSPTLQYIMIKSLAKVKGMPVLAKRPPVLLSQQKEVFGIIDSPDTVDSIDVAQASVERNFSQYKARKNKFSLSNLSLTVLQWLIGG